MPIEVINFDNEQAWLERRLKDVTSTEISALFGLSPYKTEFELFHEKREGRVIQFKPNERMKWGTRFESAIALGVAEDQGWNVEPFKAYISNTQLRIGSSFDFKIKHPQFGIGIMEIKNVDSLVFKRTWVDNGDGNLEAPAHIEMQVQHQMEVAEIDWCAIVAMVGGNTPKVIFRRRDPEIGKQIRDKVAAFWNRVDTNDAPSSDYTADADFLIQLYSQANEGESIDVSNDEIIAQLVAEYQFCGKQADELDAKRRGIKAQLLERIGTAEKAIATWGSITAGMVKEDAGTVITPEMVGTTIGARKGYRQFRVNMKREAV